LGGIINNVGGVMSEFSGIDVTGDRVFWALSTREGLSLVRRGIDVFDVNGFPVALPIVVRFPRWERRLGPVSLG
jgi:hypothetical protein